MGRRKGSKNKPKIIIEQKPTMPIDYEEYKEIKRQIRILRKLKRDTPKKSTARHDINRQIRELIQEAVKKSPIDITDTEKIPIIKEIYERKPILKSLDINMEKFTVAQLQKHLDRIKNNETII